MKPALISLLLSTLSGLACYLVAGNSLDLFIGGTFFAALLAGQLPGSWLTIPAITLGIIVCWWMPVHADMITASQWAVCAMVLFTFVAAVSFAVAAISRFLPVFGCALVTVIALHGSVGRSGYRSDNRTGWSCFIRSLPSIMNLPAWGSGPNNKGPMDSLHWGRTQPTNCRFQLSQQSDCRVQLR